MNQNSSNIPFQQKPELDPVEVLQSSDVQALAEAKKNEFLHALSELDARIRKHSEDAEAGKVVYELRELILRLEHDIGRNASFDQTIGEVMERRKSLRAGEGADEPVVEIDQKVLDLYEDFKRISRKCDLYLATREVERKQFDVGELKSEQEEKSTQLGELKNHAQDKKGELLKVIDRLPKSIRKHIRAGLSLPDMEDIQGSDVDQARETLEKMQEALDETDPKARLTKFMALSVVRALTGSDEQQKSEMQLVYDFQKAKVEFLQSLSSAKRYFDKEKNRLQQLSRDIAKSQAEIVQQLSLIKKDFLGSRLYEEFVRDKPKFKALFKGTFLGFGNLKPLDQAGAKTLESFLNNLGDVEEELEQVKIRLAEAMKAEIGEICAQKEDLIQEKYEAVLTDLTQYGNTVMVQLKPFEQAFVTLYPELLKALESRNRARLELETIRTYAIELLGRSREFPNIVSLKPQILSIDGSEIEKKDALEALRQHTRGKIIDTVVEEVHQHDIESVRLADRYTGDAQFGRLHGHLTSDRKGKEKGPQQKKEIAARATIEPLNQRRARLEELMGALRVSLETFTQQWTAMEVAAIGVKTEYEQTALQNELKAAALTQVKARYEGHIAERDQKVVEQSQLLDSTNPDIDGGIGKYLKEKIEDTKGEFYTKFIFLNEQAEKWQIDHLPKLTKWEQAKKDFESGTVLPRDYDGVEHDQLKREAAKQREIQERLLHGVIQDEQGNTVVMPPELNKQIIETGVVPGTVSFEDLSIDAARAVFERKYREEFKNIIEKAKEAIRTKYDTKTIGMCTEVATAEKESSRAADRKEMLRQRLILYGNALQQLGLLIGCLKGQNDLLKQMLMESLKASNSTLHDAFQTLFRQHDLMATLSADITADFENKRLNMTPLGSHEDVISMLNTSTQI